MRQTRALLLLGASLCVGAVALLSSSAGTYLDGRRAWRADAQALGGPRYDARASDAHYETAEAALERVGSASQLLGLGLLLAITGLFGLRSPPALRHAPGASPARALAVIWLDTSLCAALLVLNLCFMPGDARLANAILSAVVPWLMAALLTAPVAAGCTLAGLLLGTRLRDHAGKRPSPLRALLTLPLLPLTLLSAIVGLPAHLLLLALRRHPGSQSVALHLTLSGLHGIRWRRAPAAA